MNSFRASNADHTSMSDCDLSYRWTQPTHALLSAEQLARIKPLQESKAKEVWRLSLSFRQPGAPDGRPADSLYTNIEELPEAEGDLGTEWLQHRMGDETSPIIVCWNSLSAVETDAQLFVPFWEDFCYPSSDDVAIFPIHFGWLVTFWHEEHLFFGRRR
jgi:hypothetical protein